MSASTAAVTMDQARRVLGDAIVTKAPTLAPRVCTKARCTNCDRPDRLRDGLCRRCHR